MSGEAKDPYSPAWVRGGGDLGTGAALALHRAGVAVVVIDRVPPTALRLTVALAAAAIDGRTTVAGTTAVHCRDLAEVARAWARGEIPLWTGDEALLRSCHPPGVLVEATSSSVRAPRTALGDAPLVIGLGPGIVAGRHAHLVVETNRGPSLGRVIAQGEAEAWSGVPGDVCGYRAERLLVASRTGVFERLVEVGAFVEPGDAVARVDEAPVLARLRGMVRGLKLAGVRVEAGRKVGDVDPRRDRSLLHRFSDKAEAVGRGVVDALERWRK